MFSVSVKLQLLSGSRTSSCFQPVVELQLSRASCFQSGSSCSCFRGSRALRLLQLLSKVSSRSQCRARSRQGRALNLQWAGVGCGTGPTAAPLAEAEAAKAAPPPKPAAHTPKAKGKAKAKAKAINVPAGVTLGCGRCRQSLVGCRQCRARAGMTFDPVSQTWN